jgi:hypothetical protein
LQLKLSPDRAWGCGHTSLLQLNGWNFDHICIIWWRFGWQRQGKFKPALGHSVQLMCYIFQLPQWLKNLKK